MLRVKCNSAAATPRSSLYYSTFDGGCGSNGQLPDDHQLVLNLSPRPSSFRFSPAVILGRIRPEQTCLESPKAPFGSTNPNLSNGPPTKKSSAELMNEIVSLEMEILHLERYLLSVYRSAFEHHVSTLVKGGATDSLCGTSSILQTAADKACDKLETDKWMVGFDYIDKTSPANRVSGSSGPTPGATPRSSYRRGRKSAGSCHRSLGEHLGGFALDGPDRLSEDIARCISSIYCKLGNTSLSSASSSTSSTSSSGTFSTRNLSDSWSPHFNEEATDSSQFTGLKEDKRSYAEMIEVLKICLDDDSFNYASRMLKCFRSLVKRLEKVDPTKMTREEKLAFWINIHNALVMHAYLAYGTHNYVKSNSILKAAYNVGGHCVNAFVIQSSILGIRPHYSAPWLQTLLSPGKKFKAGGNRHVYAIEYPEPLVHFALCSGAFSDPAVRIYTATNIFGDLKLAKEEFIRSSIYIHRETRIYLPKIICYYAKDMALTVPGILDMVSSCVSESQREAFRRSTKGKPGKYVSWLTQSSTFRYLIHREAVVDPEFYIAVPDPPRSSQRSVVS